MQQLNFLDPDCFADLELQRKEQEEQSRAVLKSAPVNVVVKSPDVEVSLKISELEALYQKLKDIDAYLEHKSIVNDMWRSVRELKAEHNVKFEEASQLFDECGGAPVALMDELEELRNKITAKTFDSVDYEKENNLYHPPADLDKRDLYQEQINALENELAGLQEVETKSTGISDEPLPDGWRVHPLPWYPVLYPAGPVPEGQDAEAWKQWSLKSLDCPCGGVLKPTSTTTWRCNDHGSSTCSRTAHAHLNAICVIIPFSGKDEWLIPGEGLVDESRVIPAADFEHRSFLCACGGVLHPIQKPKKNGYQWRCDKHPEHGARKSARRIELFTSGSCSLAPVDFTEADADRPWEQYKGKTLQCPCCPGDLISKNHDEYPCRDEWRCNQDSTHRAWTYYNMISVVRGPADVIECVPQIKEPVLTPVEEPKPSAEEVLKPEIKPGPWQEWSGKTLQCPNCPGALVPTGSDSWVCNQDKGHYAWPHYNMLAVRVSGGARYWVPGMFDRGVIPDAETPVIEEPDNIQSVIEKEAYWSLKDAELTPQYLNEPVCPFCSGDLAQISPRGWECTGDSMHGFWIQQGCGVWTESHHRTGRSILKKVPEWARKEIKA